MTGATMLVALALGISPQGLAQGEQVGATAFGSPACGTPTVEWRVPEDAPDTEGDDAALAWADPAHCSIALNPRWQGTMFWSLSDHVCEVIAHEWGHLAGQPHGTGIMAPTFTITPECAPPRTARHARHRRHRRR